VITVEIWSDVVCPFCYIGKRNFEAALGRFAQKEDVQIIWKSFELDPAAKYEPGLSIHEVLAEKYGRSIEEAKEMTAQVAKMAAGAGLKFAIDRTVPTNTFDAHRLIHLAAKHGLQDKAEETLFAAYFTDAKQIGDKAELKELADEIGVPKDEAEKLLAGDDFGKEVRDDEAEGRDMGVNAVPCFVINRKYLVRGAQPPDVFLGALEKALKGR
jgi:predicted DsbA family dithiol-disulfide isomerase